MSTTLSTKQITADLGVSYRQIDHAVRTGYLSPSTKGQGSGYYHEWSDEDLRVIRAAGTYLRMGFVAKVAWAKANEAVRGVA